MMDMMLIALIMVIISQCMHISKHPLHSLNIYNYSLRKLKKLNAPKSIEEIESITFK